MFEFPLVSGSMSFPTKDSGVFVTEAIVVWKIIVFDFDWNTGFPLGLIVTNNFLFDNPTV